MNFIGTVGKHNRTRIFDAGAFKGNIEYLIENAPAERPSPQAFLVHQDPEWNFCAHFHAEEQFQLVVGGSGTLGSHVLAPVSVHYASREAGYGPLIAGPTGLDYLTLRSVTDFGAHVLPEQRNEMRKGLRKRQAFAGPVGVMPQTELRLLTEPKIEELLVPDETGLATWLVSLGPNAGCRAPEHLKNGGRFHVVVAGVLLDDQQLLPPGCVYGFPGEQARFLKAGPEGVVVVVLQFPASALNAEPELLRATVADSPNH